MLTNEISRGQIVTVWIAACVLATLFAACCYNLAIKAEQVIVKKIGYPSYRIPLETDIDLTIKQVSSATK